MAQDTVEAPRQADSTEGDARLTSYSSIESDAGNLHGSAEENESEHSEAEKFCDDYFQSLSDQKEQILDYAESTDYTRKQMLLRNLAQPIFEDLQQSDPNNAPRNVAYFLHRFIQFADTEFYNSADHQSLEDTAELLTITSDALFDTPETLFDTPNTHNERSVFRLVDDPEQQRSLTAEASNSRTAGVIALPFIKEYARSVQKNPEALSEEAEPSSQQPVDERLDSIKALEVTGAYLASLAEQDTGGESREAIIQYLEKTAQEDQRPLVSMLANNARINIEIERIAALHPDLSEATKTDYLNDEQLDLLEFQAQAQEGQQYLRTNYYKHHGQEEAVTMKVAHDMVAALDQTNQPVEYLVYNPEEVNGDMLDASVIKKAFRPSELTRDISAHNETVDETAAVQRLHEPYTIGYLNHELGIDIRTLPFDTQINFLEFSIGNERAGFERVKNCLQELPANNNQFIESFLALEHGEDFGEVLLDIAEAAPQEDMQELLETIGEFREMSTAFSQLFPEEIQSATEKAMSERLTELLALVREVSVNGAYETEDLNGLDVPIEVRDLPTMIEDITTLKESISQLIESVGSNTAQAVTQSKEEGFALYRFMPSQEAPRPALLYIRPEGAYGYDPQIEYGRPGEGVEASISFIANPGSDEYISPYKKGRAQDELSIRLDREGLEPGYSPTDTDRDPTRETGTISLDIGSILGRGESFGTRIGREIAAGNQLRAQRLGIKPRLNHNSEAFDQERFGTSEGFAGLARKMDSMAMARLNGAGTDAPVPGR